MSKHSIRRGISGSRNAAWMFSSASVLRRALGVEPRSIGEFSVASHQLQQPALVAALRHADSHPTAGALREPALNRLGLLRQRRHVHVGRRLLIRVELLHRRFDHRGLAARVGTRFRRELHALDDAAASHEEHLHDDAARPDLDAEHVAIAQLGAGHLLLPLADGLHRPHRVTKRRSLLEPFVLRRIHHPRFEVVRQLVVPAFQEQAGVLHRLPVTIGRAQRQHARRQAALDVVLQARPPALAGDHLVAGADAEQLVRQPHGAPGQLGGQERARVEVAIALHRARHQHARKRFTGGQLQVGVVLVVAEQDVVARRPLLDQVVLERQRLDHRVGDDDGEAGDVVQQRVGLGARPVGSEVAPDPVAQAPGLADIDGLPRLVGVEIHPWLLWQACDLVFQVVDGHGDERGRCSDRTSSPRLAPLPLWAGCRG